MIDDVDINKAAIIRRCLTRIREETADGPSSLENITIQDAVTLNLLRACEASIELAMHRVVVGKLGVPQSSRNAFQLLSESSAITEPCSNSMSNMVGFRNIALHSDQEIETPILNAIIFSHLTNFENFLSELAL